MYRLWDIWHLIFSPNAPLTRGELLVAEYPGLLVGVALVHVGGKGTCTWGRSQGTKGCLGRLSRGYLASGLGARSHASGDTPKAAQSRQNRT